jgi:hypothetical protein
MKTNRFWIELIGLSTGIACLLAFLIATLGAAAAGSSGASDPQTEAAPAAPQSKVEQTVEPVPAVSQSPDADTAQQTYAGMVTCARCEARHPANYDKSATDCARACVRSGSNFALIDGDKSYVLEGDLTILKEFAGRRARVVGAMNGKTIRVSSVSAET